MKLKSMRLSTSEVKETEPANAVPEKPRYPYGLGLQLDNEALEKLAVGMPKVGDSVMIVARANVTGAMEQEFDGGPKHRSVHLQITDMGVGPDEGEGGDAAEKLYDGPK